MVWNAKLFLTCVEIVDVILIWSFIKNFSFVFEIIKLSIAVCTLLGRSFSPQALLKFFILVFPLEGCKAIILSENNKRITLFFLLKAFVNVSSSLDIFVFTLHLVCFLFQIIDQVHALVFLLDIILIGEVAVVSILLTRKADQIIASVAIVDLRLSNEEPIAELTIEFIASGFVTLLRLFLVPVEEFHFGITSGLISKRDGVIAIDPVVDERPLISPVEQVTIVFVLGHSFGTEACQLLLSIFVSFVGVTLFIDRELVLALFLC